MFFGKPKTSDQELVDEIRKTTENLRKLCRQADSRGITCWIRTGKYGGEIVRGVNISFDTAYKSEVTKL